MLSIIKKSLSCVRSSERPPSYRCSVKEATAYHEAGHVLGMWHSNFGKLHLATIEPEKHDDTVSLGFVSHNTLVGDNSFSIMCGQIAGEVAEYMFVSSEEGEEEKEEAMKVLGSMSWEIKEFITHALKLARLKETEATAIGKLAYKYIRMSIQVTYLLLKIHYWDLLEVKKALLRKKTLHYKNLCMILDPPEPKLVMKVYDHVLHNPSLAELETVYNLKKRYCKLDYEYQSRAYRRLHKRDPDEEILQPLIDLVGTWSYLTICGGKIRM